MKPEYLLFIPSLKPLSRQYQSIIQSYIGIKDFEILNYRETPIQKMYEAFKAYAREYEIAVMHHCDWFMSESGLITLIAGIKTSSAAVVGTHGMTKTSGSWKMCSWGEEPHAVTHIYAVNVAKYNWDAEMKVPYGDQCLREQAGLEVKVASVPVWEFTEASH